MSTPASAPAPSVLPSTMRAWTWSKRGPPSVLHEATLPVPTLPPPKPKGHDEWLLVKVAYAGLNLGTVVELATIPAAFRAKDGVAEMDFSGVVVDEWTDGTTPAPPTSADPYPRTRFETGDRVAGFLPVSYALGSGAGALAEYVRVPAAYVVRIAPTVGMADAPCLLAGMTAAALVRASGAKKGDRVLVNAAGGGIGTMAVQMLRALGASVVGVASKSKEVVRGLGAEDVVDYKEHAPLAPYLASQYTFDAVVDALGIQALYKASHTYLCAGGKYASVGIAPASFTTAAFLRVAVAERLNAWWPMSTWLGGTGREWCGVTVMGPTTAQREEVMDMLGKGDVRVVRDSVWKFEEAREAYEYICGRHAAGRVIVKVDPRAEE